MGTKLFTPGTARAALEAIRPAAETMARVYRAMEVMRPGKAVSDQLVDRTYFVMVRALVDSLGRLEDAGVQVKDPRLGLLDFPARRAGRVVLLCWKVGEPSVGHWHEAEVGFAGRQPLDEDGPWEEQETLVDGPG